ncbi:peptidyl-tRNA hydrolase [Leisingera caerulea]|uniref:peptidyl-tRNA hydrolase n=1 Tax=Leisingera caerulea TaxID=506591 RepID=UPI002ADDC2AA|nr:peptidyl-tRNA hydrolase [Leisingera caerulea]
MPAEKVAPDETLRLYAVLRGDLIMSEGKSNAQAGHAYVDTLLSSLSHGNTELRANAEGYASLRPGTKVCLDGGSEDRLELLASKLDAAGIPYVRIIDQDHIEPPHFDGSPVLTAIGAGPFTRRDTPKCLRRLPMWTGGARGAAQSFDHRKTKENFDEQ